MALRRLFLFRQAQSFLNFSSEVCAILQALRWSGQSAISLFLSDSLVLATLSSPLSFLLPRFFSQIWQELSSFSSCAIRFRRVPRHLFLPGSDAADELTKRGALLVPSAIPYSLSCLVSTLVFSRTRSVLSHLNSLTNRFPRFPLKNLCSLVTLNVCSFISAATDTADC